MAETLLFSGRARFEEGPLGTPLVQSCHEVSLQVFGCTGLLFYYPNNSSQNPLESIQSTTDVLHTGLDTGEALAYSFLESAELAEMEGGASSYGLIIECGSKTKTAIRLYEKAPESVLNV